MSSAASVLLCCSQNTVEGH